jgi:hypothetical protein
MKRLNVPALVAISLSILSVSTGFGIQAASSHTISAPLTVYADEEGVFTYRFTCTTTAVVAWSGIGWSSDANVLELAVWDDCYCIECLLSPGEEVHYEVQGHLKNPQYSGTVKNWVIFCEEDSTVLASTMVIPYNPTDSVPATWGRIKAFY